MAQTPYLNILGIDKVSGTLAQLNLPPATKLTPDVARQICGKTDSKMVISQSIGDAGNGYHLQMRALECGSGATLAKEQADIGKRNEVVPADSLARFNQPLEKALSSSLEALQAGTQADKLYLAGRLLVGTSRHDSPSLLADAISAADPAMLTVSVRRQLSGSKDSGQSFWNLLRGCFWKSHCSASTRSAGSEAYVVVDPVRRTAVLVQPWHMRATYLPKSPMSLGGA
jgi:hypothetical protein